MKNKQSIITICHLYPKEMNIYGDIGNRIILVKRLQWRGYKVKVDEVSVGDNYDFTKADILLAGGGQDSGQITVSTDLQVKKEAIKEAHDEGLPMLLVCGSYQLFGRKFITNDNRVIEGIGLLDIETTASDTRMIGNITIETKLGNMVGFENHSGKTVLGPKATPLGKVKQGFGNDGKSGYEGVIMGNCFGTYLHGPALSKNPNLADKIIKLALQRRDIYDEKKFIVLDDTLEEAALNQAMLRPR